MATRKKPRTAAQKRATKKLIAFNKARKALNKKRAGAKPKRKAPRTAKQRAATRKLVALNRRRKAAQHRTKKTVFRKRKTTKRKTTKRKAVKRGWIIRAKVQTGQGILTYYIERKKDRFTRSKTDACTWGTETSAESAMKRFAKVSPGTVISLQVIKK